jgi:ABC-2 type transport system permease protein
MTLLTTEIWRSFVSAWRYRANFLSGLALHTLTFYAIFLGANYMAGSANFGESLNAVVIGYSAWVLVIRCFGKTPRTIELEAATGVLEAVFQCARNCAVLYTCRAFAEATIDIALTAIMIVVIMYLTDAQVSFSPAIAIPVVTLTLAAIGIGMITGALTLQLKRVNSILQPLQIALTVLIFTPFETWTGELMGGLAAAANLLPMVPSVVMLRHVMLNDGGLEPQMIAYAAINGGAYLLLGMAIFQAMLVRARTHGLVSGY